MVKNGLPEAEGADLGLKKNRSQELKYSYSAKVKLNKCDRVLPGNGILQKCVEITREAREFISLGVKPRRL